MTNNRQKPTHSEKTNLKKIPQLQPLNLEQLDGVAGGPANVGGTGDGGDPGTEDS